MSDDTLPSIISYGEDISNAEAPKALPAGDYPAEIEGAEQKVSQQGNDYIQVMFRISLDDFPADFDPTNAPEGLVLSYNRLSPNDNTKARWFMRKFLEAIGAPMGRDVNPLDWVGQRAILQLGVRKYEGVDQNEIKAIKAP